MNKTRMGRGFSWWGVFLAMLAATAVTAMAAAPNLFSLRIDGHNLVVTDPKGKIVATIPPETIGKTVKVGGYSFEVTYGKNAMGDMALILTASPGNPGGLSFSVNGRNVEMGHAATSGAVSVTITVSNMAGQVVTRVEATTPQSAVVVDGKPVTTVAAAASVPIVISTVAGSTLPTGAATSTVNGSGFDATGSTVLQPTTGTVNVNLTPGATTPY